MRCSYKVQESIKDLPIKPTQVNSSKYTPYIRNQHVQNKTLKPRDNKTKNEHIKMGEGTTSIMHRLSNGKVVEIEGGEISTPFGEEQRIKMSSAELDKHYQDLSMGYIRKTNLSSEKITDVFEKIEDSQRIDVSKDLLHDFGFDSFMEHANIDKDDKFTMDVFLVDEQNTKYSEKAHGMELTLYTDKQVTNPEKSSAFASDGGYDPEYDDSPSQAVYSLHISRDNENDRLDVYHAYTRIETDNPIKGAGVKTKADAALGARNIARKIGLNNVHISLEAALTTGTYLWNTMGYDVSKGSREEYLQSLQTGVDKHIRENVYSEKEYQDVITKHKTAIAANTKLFKETGRTQHLIDNAYILYNEIPGVQKAFKNHREWYRDTISKVGAMFMCEMNFNVNDTLESNDHLRRLNAKHIETFGKPMPW